MKRAVCTARCSRDRCIINFVFYLWCKCLRKLRGLNCVILLFKASNSSAPIEHRQYLCKLSSHDHRQKGLYHPLTVAQFAIAYPITQKPFRSNGLWYVTFKLIHLVASKRQFVMTNLEGPLLHYWCSDLFQLWTSSSLVLWDLKQPYICAENEESDMLKKLRYHLWLKPSESARTQFSFCAV